LSSTPSANISGTPTLLRLAPNSPRRPRAVLVNFRSKHSTRPIRRAERFVNRRQIHSFSTNSVASTPQTGQTKSSGSSAPS
jgi:hypothetical protein